MSGDVRSYHYVLTLQWQTVTGGLAFNTVNGVTEVKPGGTGSRYQWLLADFMRNRGAPEAVTVFFSLEPDGLAVSPVPVVPGTTEEDR